MIILLSGMIIMLSGVIIMLSGINIMLCGMIIISCGMIILLGGMIRIISRMIIMLWGMNACASLGRVYPLGPELHKDLSTLHSPVLHLDVFPLPAPGHCLLALARPL